MGIYADIYVIKKNRSMQLVLDFLDHFLPDRKEGADEYYIPEYADEPDLQFEKAEELMEYLEQDNEFTSRIYWRNLDKDNLNRHGMIFYLKGGYMVFGISRDAKGMENTKNEEDCLRQMVCFLGTNEGYITYECIPEDNYEDFIEAVVAYKKIFSNKKS